MKLHGFDVVTASEFVIKYDELVSQENSEAGSQIFVHILDFYKNHILPKFEVGNFKIQKIFVSQQNIVRALYSP